MTMLQYSLSKEDIKIRYDSAVKVYREHLKKFRYMRQEKTDTRFTLNHIDDKVQVIVDKENRKVLVKRGDFNHAIQLFNPIKFFNFCNMLLLPPQTVKICSKLSSANRRKAYIVASNTAYGKPLKKLRDAMAHIVMRELDPEILSLTAKAMGIHATTEDYTIVWKNRESIEKLFLTAPSTIPIWITIAKMSVEDASNFHDLSVSEIRTMVYNYLVPTIGSSNFLSYDAIDWICKAPISFGQLLSRTCVSWINPYISFLETLAETKIYPRYKLFKTLLHRFASSFDDERAYKKLKPQVVEFLKEMFEKTPKRNLTNFIDNVFIPKWMGLITSEPKKTPYTGIAYAAVEYIPVDEDFPF